MDRDFNHNLIGEAGDGINRSRQMPLSHVDSPVVVEGNVDGECESKFPLLSFPNEIIKHTFSFLDLKSRCRARGVNKRLYGIEAETKYYVEYMRIEEVSRETQEEDNESMDGLPDYDDTSYDERITFFKEKEYSSDCITKLARNTSVGMLEVNLSGSSDFHREVYCAILRFKPDQLYMSFEENNELMDNSMFLDLCEACNYLHVDESLHITADAIYPVYQDMINGETKLHCATLCGIERDTCFDFLSYLGITVREGRYTTDDEETNTMVFMKFVNDIPICPAFFHGFFEISFSDSFHFSPTVDMKIHYHGFGESFMEAINAMGRMGFEYVTEE